LFPNREAIRDGLYLFPARVAHNGTAACAPRSWLFLAIIFVIPAFTGMTVRVKCGMDKKLTIVSAAVLVREDGHVLVAQRPEGKAMAGLWEFPGGKLEPGESPEDALIRELHEELAIDVLAEDLAPLQFVSHGYEQFHLLMPTFICRRWQGQPQALWHKALQWLPPAALYDVAMPPADAPLLPLLSRIY
jgi:8-oxo-dGTP diphosphatase